MRAAFRWRLRGRSGYFLGNQQDVGLLTQSHLALAALEDARGKTLRSRVFWVILK